MYESKLKPVTFSVTEQSMINAVESCLNFDTEIRLCVGDSKFLCSQTGAMMHRRNLCSFDMATVIPIEAIAKMECYRHDKPVITVTLKKPTQ